MTTEQKIIKTKVELLELAKQLGNVSKACKLMGYCRDSFYRSCSLVLVDCVCLAPWQLKHRAKAMVCLEIPHAVIFIKVK